MYSYFLQWHRSSKKFNSWQEQIKELSMSKSTTTFINGNSPKSVLNAQNPGIYKKNNFKVVLQVKDLECIIYQLKPLFRVHSTNTHFKFKFQLYEVNISAITANSKVNF